MLHSFRSLSGTGRPGVPLELPIRTLPQWGVPDARSALERHEIGQFRASALLAEAMTQDPRVSAVLSTRVKVLTGLPRQFVPADDSDLARELAHLAEAEWLRWVPEPDAEALHRWLLLMGLGLGQLIWDRSRIPWRPRLNVWHPSNLYWYWDTDRQLGKYQLVTAVEGGIVEPIPGDGQWIFARSGAKRPWMAGLVRTLAVPWIVRLYARQDWARYSEVHGLPIRKAVIPAQATQEDIELFESQLRNIGGEATVTVKQGADGNRFDFQLVEATSNTHAAFGDLMATQDADIAIAVLGQNLTTEVDGGSRAAISGHELIRHDLLEADASLMGSVWTDQVLRPWAALNYGRADLAPTLRYVTDPPEDAQKKAMTLAALAQALAAFEAAKIPVDRERILRELGVPMMGPNSRMVQLDDKFEAQHPRHGAGTHDGGKFRGADYTDSSSEPLGAGRGSTPVAGDHPRGGLPAVGHGPDSARLPRPSPYTHPPAPRMSHPHPSAAPSPPPPSAAPPSPPPRPTPTPTPIPTSPPAQPPTESLSPDADPAAIVAAVNPSNDGVNCGKIIDSEIDRLTRKDSRATAAAGRDGTFNEIGSRHGTQMNFGHSIQDAFDAVGRAGDGTVAIVGFNWGPRGAHVVVMINQNNNVRILEAQDWGPGNPKEVIDSPARANARYNAHGNSDVGYGILPKPR